MRLYLYFPRSRNPPFRIININLLPSLPTLVPIPIPVLPTPQPLLYLPFPHFDKALLDSPLRGLGSHQKYPSVDAHHQASGPDLDRTPGRLSESLLFDRKWAPPSIIWH